MACSWYPEKSGCRIKTQLLVDRIMITNSFIQSDLKIDHTQITPNNLSLRVASGEPISCIEGNTPPASLQQAFKLNWNNKSVIGSDKSVLVHWTVWSAMMISVRGCMHPQRVYCPRELKMPRQIKLGHMLASSHLSQKAIETFIQRRTNKVYTTLFNFQSSCLM